MAINKNPDIASKLKARKKFREKRGKSTTIEPKSRGNFPLMIERRYERDLVRTVNQAHDLVKETLFPQLESILREARAEDPRFDSYVDSFVAIIAGIKLAFGQKVKPIDLERGAQDSAQDVEQANKAIFERQFSQVLGVKPFLTESWLAAEMSNYVEQNVTLIKSVHEEYFKNIEFEVLNGVQTGRNTKDIAKAISKRTGASKKRARLIARDQVGKLNSNLASRRAAEVGVKKFRWSTSGDERVRSSHQALNNKIFTYKDGASVDGDSNVLPGQPINCRCVAIPILSTIND